MLQRNTLVASYTIFHLRRRDGSPAFLYPFVGRGSFLTLPTSVELTGLYGEEPRVESLTLLRNELYRRIDEDIREWINDKRFIPRFLLASAAFLVVFLFLSLVVHTPIPLVDELLGSTVAAVVVFILLGRSFEHSRSASQRRVQLRSLVDNVVFIESEYVKKLERVYQRLEASDPTSVSVGGESDAQALWESDPEQTAATVSLLKQLLATKPAKRAYRELQRGRFSTATERAVETGAVDPTLVLLYLELVAAER